MQINEQVIDVIKEFDLHHEDAICYLLVLYFDMKPSYIPEMLVAQMNRTGIYEMDNHGTLQWKIPLFSDQVTAFGWVKTEYVQMFIDANPEKKGIINTSVARMKQLFAKNPEIRKEDVIGATKMYIRNTDSKYIRKSHYFIFKGKGAEKIEDIKEWLEKYKISLQTTVGRSSASNTMQ